MRRIAAAIVVAVAWIAASGPAADAGEVQHEHAIALHGNPKYGPDFQHFDYVNPNAPVGGTLRLGVTGTFDSFNPYVIKGNPAAGVGAETLLTASADEPFTEYGLIAESIEWPEDRSWVIFHLRPEARWHDGQPITADDVVFSLDILKSQGRPQYRFYYHSVVRAEKLDARTVRFVFDEAENRELPLIVGQLPILPKHYWEGRDFERGTLEPPLFSGPYRVADFEPGRFVELERVPDYWGRNLPVNIGQNNFQRIHYDYFRDDTVVRQVLKAGEIDYRLENQAKAWALDYDVPAVREGRLKKEAIEHERPAGMQALIMNTRRPVFADRRVRRALAYAFDFEWTNRTLFFGQYVRTESYFANSELASSGPPEGEELEILEPYRGQVPDAVFEREYRAPGTDGSGWPRDNLARAFELLEEAGWAVRDMRLMNEKTGQPMQFEILIVSPTFERVILPFVRNLKRLGIEATLRLVDQSQYINRVQSFDFDMILGGWGQSDSPGNEQRNYWTTAAAEQPGSQNYAGVRDPAVDALVEQLIQAPTREALIARTRALDRVLLWGHYVIPNWHLRVDRILYWDKFGRPEITPKNGTSLDYWWYDAEKAARLESGEPASGGAANSNGGGWLTALAVLAGLALVGYALVRRALGRPGR